MRKLATIREINDILPIPDADRICAYVIDGWTIVDSVNSYKVGDIVIMCEIDSWIPHDIAPFLSKGQEPRVYEGVKGERLKSVRLKKQLSQGLILPVSKLAIEVSHADVGMDVTDYLGIRKYEKPVAANLAGFARGNFPSFIPKTDQERCLRDTTRINTDRGNVPIANIIDQYIAGNRINVLSFDHQRNRYEFKEIIGIKKSKPIEEKWVKITTSSGQVLTCTADHKIYNASAQCYVEASQLQVGDSVIKCNLHEM